MSNPGSITLEVESGAPDQAFIVGDLRRGRLRIGVAIPADATLGLFRVDATL